MEFDPSEEQRPLIGRIAGIIAIAWIFGPLLGLLVPGGGGARPSNNFFSNPSSPAIVESATHSGTAISAQAYVAAAASTVFAVFIVLLVTHMRSRGILATLAYLSAGGIMATNWVSASLVYAMVDAAHRTGSDAGVVALFSAGKTMAEADGGFVAIAIVAMSILGLRSRTFPGPICWLGIVAGGYHFVEVPIQLAVTGTATGKTGPIGVVIGELWVLLVGVTLVVQSIRRPQPSPDKQQAQPDVAGETVSART